MAVTPKEKCKFYTGAVVNNTTTYTEVAQLLDVQDPSTAQEAIETTVKGATAKTYRPSLIPESGPIEVLIQYDAANNTHTTLRGWNKDGLTHPFKVEHVDAANTVVSNTTFTAFVESWTPQGDNNYEVAVSLRTTGLVVYAAT